ncbi:unnamed protein product [Bursaphelenchus okinawaensis]|uniref:Gamma-tubulin complex component n=1 Tax=Bursaphelenchus okinawaensis TaxID=465554 RepID=A0A811K889_9BILA|nr:unnamed protein product [Bursaphelenchus okinawaensis]CAG9093790.1 unnamed protein product [Bursaphelenchus okinawaensis]
MEPLKHDVNYQNTDKELIDDQRLVREVLLHLLPTSNSDVIRYSPAVGCTLSARYCYDSKVFGFNRINEILIKSSQVKKNLAKINEFNRSNVNVKAMFFPLAPIVSVSTNYYNEITDKIEQSVNGITTVDELNVEVCDLNNDLQNVITFLEKLLNPSPSYHDVEMTWTAFFKFRKSYTNPTSVLPFIKQLQEALINLLPNYFDTLCVGSSDIEQKGEDIILTMQNKDRMQMVHFTMIWSQKLLRTFKQGIKNRLRLELHRKNVEVKPWSYFMKNLFDEMSTEAKLQMDVAKINHFLEDSCSSYVAQFSQIIFNVLKTKDCKRWMMDFKKIYQLELFEEQICRSVSVEYNRSPRSAKLSAFAKCLEDLNTKENCSKYYKINWSDEEQTTFKVVPELPWPINVMFHDRLFTLLNKSMQILHVLKYCNSMCVTALSQFTLSSEVRDGPLLVRQKLNLILLMKKLTDTLKDLSTEFFNNLMENAGQQIEVSTTLESIEEAVTTWEEKLKVSMDNNTMYSIAIDRILKYTTTVYEELEQPVTEFDVSQMHRSLKRILITLKNNKDPEELDSDSLEYCYYCATNECLMLLNTCEAN